jgi:hypothetical protein
MADEREIGFVSQKRGPTLSGKLVSALIGQSPAMDPFVETPEGIQSKSCCSPEFAKRTQSRENGRQQSVPAATLVFIVA